MGRRCNTRHKRKRLEISNNNANQMQNNKRFCSKKSVGQPKNAVLRQLHIDRTFAIVRATYSAFYFQAKNSLARKSLEQYDRLVSGATLMSHKPAMFEKLRRCNKKNSKYLIVDVQFVRTSDGSLVTLSDNEDRYARFKANDKSQKSCFASAIEKFEASRHPCNNFAKCFTEVWHSNVKPTGIDPVNHRIGIFLRTFLYECRNTLMLVEFKNFQNEVIFRGFASLFVAKTKRGETKIADCDALTLSLVS